MTTSGISLGDTVKWSGQSAGYTKEKTGIVEEVVSAKGVPSRERFPQLYKSAGVGLPRDHAAIEAAAAKTAS
jgi:hypothetical protein